MDQHRFFNACMILMNLDMHELVDAGIIKAGNVDNGGTSWKRFNDEPLTFLAKIDDVKRDALWKLIEARQTCLDVSKLNHARAIELLGDSLTAWEGEEESVKEEHADLIAELEAFLEQQPQKVDANRDCTAEWEAAVAAGETQDGYNDWCAWLDRQERA